MATKKKTDGIASVYAQSEGTYRDFATCARDLIAQIISATGIKVHSVTCRAKTQASLAGKLQRAGKSYSSLGEITDLAGVRIITHFADEAEKIAAIIEREFDVDNDNSVDKRRLLEPDQFGYLSIHHVVRLPARRVSLPEYARFQGLKAEVQTRSILQHAWAEIEHDLGYKSTVAVPRRLRRRISRLAGLLELADQEFQTVRDEIESYERDLPRLVLERPNLVELDKSSLQAYVQLGAKPRAIDAEIATLVSDKLSDEIHIDYALSRLAWLGVSNLGQIDEYLEIYKDPIVRFAVEFLSPRDSAESKMSRGMSVFYLAYVLVGQRSPQVIEQFARVAMGSDEQDHARRFAELIAAAWQRAMKPLQGDVKASHEASPALPKPVRRTRRK